MRATELLGAPVVDATGTTVGHVHDIRVTAEGADRFRVAGLVVGSGLRSALAHVWGFGAGRAGGPWLFRALLAPAGRRARFVPADRVSDWGPRRVEIEGRGEYLARLHEVDA
jgi:hypothetical protein